MGDFTLEKLIGPAEYGDKLGLYARVIVPPKAAVPYHQHLGDSEVYYILSGEGIYDDDGKKIPAKPGDTFFCADGHSHGITPLGDEPIVFIALIING